jgi:hypothetical protein
MSKKPIDVHVHPSTKEYLIDSGGKYLEDAMRYFGKDIRSAVKSVEEMAAEYETLGVRGILLAWDAETGTGLKKTSNEYIAGIVEKFPDVFVAGFASVDPWKRNAAKEVEKAVKELGLRGLKFQQAAQKFFPNDKMCYPIYEKCVELNIPVLYHTGTTGYGAGAKGGDGIRLSYTKPIPYIDDVAADFPELKIIGAHPSWPWQEEMLAVAVHKANVYLDLSGWSPKYFSPSLVQYANTFLKDKVMFGTDYPFISPQKWLKDFESAGFKPELRDKILWENAEKILGV